MGISLLGNKKEFSKGKKRITIPGQHGNNTRRRKASNYALQNKEKQKLRFLYGLRERQLRNLFTKLKSKQGEIAYNLLLALESRFDNIVFRSGIGTRRFARQLVNHGHFTINGERVNIPSYQLKVGDRIEFSRELLTNEKVKYFIEKKGDVHNHSYISFEPAKRVIELKRNPLSEEIANSEISMKLIVEWYNRKV